MVDNKFFINSHKNVQVGSAGSVIQDYGSKDPDPKEIFTDLQHWLAVL